MKLLLGSYPIQRCSSLGATTWDLNSALRIRRLGSRSSGKARCKSGWHGCDMQDGCLMKCLSGKKKLEP
jgi:hypothetical protein